MATAAKTGTPRRQGATTRTTTAKAATKPAATKAAPAKTEAPAAEAELAKVGPIELVFDRETKSFAVFKAPEGTGCTGSLYAPLGTTEVRVMLYGPASALDAVEA